MSTPKQPRRLTTSTLTLMTVAAAWLTFAPFTPEPHLFGKLRWVFGGAEGMGTLDWADLAMHGCAALALPFLLVAVIRRRRT